jgi:monoamine oxidase
MSIPVDRREFLKLGFLAASAQLTTLRSWSFTPQALPHSTSPKKVLILGAGLAGLVAAYELTEAGHDVTVLEAQLRPGGRVHTLREPFADGLYAEAGAARILDNHDLTLHYVKQFGLNFVPFFPKEQASVFLLKGKRIPAKSRTELDLFQVPLDLTPEERRLGMTGLGEKYLGPAMRVMGDPDAPDWPNTAAKAYDSVTMAEFLKKQGASHGAIELLEYPFQSAEEDPGSFLYNLREFWHDSRAAMRYKIEGGNDLLPKGFAAKLQERVHYGSPVMRIEHNSRKVRAVVRQFGTHHTFEGDHLICTVPFPALRRVEVYPPFSELRRRAIAELQYMPETRVILQCRTRYWEADGHNGFGMSDLPQLIWHPTHDQPGTRGLLLSRTFLSMGQRVGTMSEEERLEFVSREMEKVHPGLAENLEGAVSKIWKADPWAGGAISLHAPEQLTTTCTGIERPEGRVHFAGEHTSRWPGWMQGALESGLRAAKEVHESNSVVA